MGDPVSIDLKALMLANVETNEMSANVMYGVPATYPDLTMAVTHFSTSWYFSNTSWRCQNPKYENGFKHLWHLASGWAMNTNDENLWFFLFG